jgi:ABC-type Na+ efflux pump permease subunit
VRPARLLAGKVIGIGAVALARVVDLVGFALELAKAVGSSLVHGAAPLVVAATLIWLTLGYAFYSWLYTAAGSQAESQDQVQSLALPLGAPLIFGYIVSVTGVRSGNASLRIKVPLSAPTAPFAVPTLLGFGTQPGGSSCFPSRGVWCVSSSWRLYRPGCTGAPSGTPVHLDPPHPRGTPRTVVKGPRS